MKYLIFDIDGTLTDTTTVDDMCYMNSFESLFGINIENTDWSTLKHVTDWGIAEELISINFNRAVKFQEINALKKLFVNALKKEIDRDNSQFREIAGAVTFFNSLVTNTNFQIGIATGGWEESASLKLKTVGINPLTLSYSNSNYFKSRALITKDVIEQLNKRSSKTPTEIIYFGDGEWDYLTCQKLGIRFIGIDSKKNRKLEKLGATEVYQDFLNSDIILKSIMLSSK